MLIGGITAACNVLDAEEEASKETAVSTSLSAGVSPHNPNGSTYVVATSGNDDNDGSEAAPWRTIQHAADSVAAGDTVLIRGGSYNEAVFMNVSGSEADGVITFMSYEGETAVLDGTSLSNPDGDIGIDIIDQSYLIIKGLEIRNYTTTTADAVPMGIAVSGASHHIELRDNDIHHIETHAPLDGDLLGADAHGIAFYGDTAVSIHDIIIDGNHLHDLILGSSEALVVNGNVEKFTISHNSVHDTDNIAIVMIGFEETAPPAGDRARDGIVSDNIVYNVNSATNPSYDGEQSADGIYVDGGTQITIERNIVHHANLGMEITSEHGNGDASFVTVRNNLLYRNGVTGIGVGGYDELRGSTHDCIFVNNTFFQNDTLGWENGEMLFQYNVHDNIIRNNIFYTTAQSFFFGDMFTTTSNNTVNNNLFFAPGGADSSRWQWNTMTYTGFAAYKAATGNDGDSLFADPLLTDTANSEPVESAIPDLHLTAASPAIDAGANLPEAGDVDFDGRLRIQNGAMDIGAYEFGEEMATYLPIVTTPQAAVAGSVAKRPFPQHLTYAAGTIRPTHRSQSQQDDDVRAAYDAWKAAYLIADGTNGDGNALYRISHGSEDPWRTVSEGQGYGMIIVAHMAGYETDAQSIFDGLWHFSRAHPSQIDGRLMAWQVPEDADTGIDSAFDGDADIAYGLLLADAQWGSDGDVDYAAKAAQLINAIYESTIGADSHLPELGDWVEADDVSHGQYSPRSSDFMPAHFRSYGRFTANPVWDDVYAATQSAISHMQADYSPIAGLLPDFIVPISADDHSLQPAPPHHLEGEHDGRYEYNAGRDPWRIATDGLLNDDAVSQAQAQKIANWIVSASGGDPANIKAGYDLDGTPLASGDYFSTFFAAPFGTAAMTTPANQQFLNDVYDAVYNIREDYYEDSVTLLCLLLMTGNYWDGTAVSAAAHRPDGAIQLNIPMRG